MAKGKRGKKKTGPTAIEQFKQSVKRNSAPKAPQSAQAGNCAAQIDKHVPVDTTRRAVSTANDPLRHHIARVQRGLTVLPVDAFAHEVVERVQTQRVTVIQGSTGCGKSTRIPRYIADCVDGAKIICTQPRRKAATKVAQRIAEEWGMSMNEPGSRIGYYIKDEHAGDFRHMTIQMVTTGWLLQMLVHNPDYLRYFSHVVLDEVHERDVDPDILFFIIRRVLSMPGLERVRLVLMSATVNVALFTEYFQTLSPTRLLPPLCIDQQVHSVSDAFLDELTKEKSVAGIAGIPALAALFGFGKLNDRLISHKAEQLLFNRHVPEMWTMLIKEIALARMKGSVPGMTGGDAILVFLPGIRAIEDVYDRLFDVLGDDDRIVLYQFHSEVEFDDDVFAVPQPGKTHVILATTIAETSVTIPNVTTVIDTGVAKRPVGDPQGNIILRPTWISQSSALQRRGRTGRVCPGLCVRLYPRWFFDRVMPANPMSVIQALPLETVVLKLLMVNPSETPGRTLTQLLEAPESDRLDYALENDYVHGFVTTPDDATTAVTPLGEMACSMGLSAPLTAALISAVATFNAKIIRTVAVAAAMNVAGRLPYVMGSWRFDPHPEMFAAHSMRCNNIGRPPHTRPSAGMTCDVAASDVEAMCQVIEAFVSTPKSAQTGFFATRGLKKELFTAFMTQLHSICSSICQTFPEDTRQTLAQAFAAFFPRRDAVARDGGLFSHTMGGFMLGGLLVSGIRELDRVGLEKKPLDLRRPLDEEGWAGFDIGSGMRSVPRDELIAVMNSSPALVLHLSALKPGQKTTHPELLTAEYWETAAEYLLNSAYDPRSGQVRARGRSHKIGCVVTKIQGSKKKSKSLVALLYNLQTLGPIPEADTSPYAPPFDLLSGSLYNLMTVTTGARNDTIVFPGPDRVRFYNRRECQVDRRMPLLAKSGGPGPNRPADSTVAVPFTFRNAQEIKAKGTAGSHTVLRRRAVSMHSVDCYAIPVSQSLSQVGANMVSVYWDAVHLIRLPSAIMVVFRMVFDPDFSEVEAALDADDQVLSVTMYKTKGDIMSSGTPGLTLDDLVAVTEVTGGFDKTLKMMADHDIRVGSAIAPWTHTLLATVRALGAVIAQGLDQPGQYVRSVRFVAKRGLTVVWDGPTDLGSGVQAVQGQLDDSSWF
ncbi:Helicase conserved C-terminal domain [Carpediemonas membranifera]|uniref:Helicase conserved C-terminal domain n=1 Tax=Carpediemonas membranifera TaxID=201153 RepID=A0A8J6BD05_9EUKA|nr:Helicase conserved C-terminal domain [Carpediemonas membranifera]|eukprot:KAG9394902.1 Helicase conserved C-terminal domain [Carpediemonas membranifera]